MDGYQLLANAIIEQAANDYRVALVAQHDGIGTSDGTVKKLENWFAGPEFRLYSKLDGAWIARRIKAELQKFNYDLDAVRRAHLSQQRGLSILE